MNDLREAPTESQSTRAAAPRAPEHEDGAGQEPAPRPVAIEAAPSVTLEARAASLFLDLDGTLADFAPTPEEVLPLAARTDLLTRLSRMLEGRVAVVSGRTIAEVDRILEKSVLCVAGVHGLERRGPDGEIARTPPHAALPQAISFFDGLARANPGAILEVKPLGVALHFRACPEIEESARVLAMELSRTTGLAMQEGSMVIELLTPGRNKGEAVKDFMAAAPFAGSVPVFLGDDLTDEHAFRAVAGLGGVGVIVGPRVETAATARLGGVAQVMAWLGRSLDERRFKIGGLS